MAIVPAITAEDFQAEDEGQFSDVQEYVSMPDGEEIEIIIEEDGGEVSMEAMEDATSGSERDAPFDGNLAEFLSDTELKSLSSSLVQSIEYDISARSEWEDGLKRGLQYLGTNYEERTEPFRGSSGVVHPLLAESVVQFQAHAYSETFPSGGPARTQVVGSQSSESTQQAERVKNFLNYLVTEVVEDYEEEQDDCLFNLPMDGSAFKKLYWDEQLQRPAAKFVRAADIIVPYTTKAIETASRLTHKVTMPVTDVNSRVASNFYRDVTLQTPGPEQRTRTEEARGKVEGLAVSMERDEYTLYEIHCRIDLVGFEDIDETGEPTGVSRDYIVTIEVDSGEVLSIYRNWIESDPLMRKIQHFVQYKFLPGVGFYGFGLTHMIGNLSRAATGILRQLIDAGTFSNLPGGFKAKGLRGANDQDSIAPGEWRDVDIPGGNLREGIIPLPYKEPSATLFQLMGYLVEAGQRFHTVNLEKVADSNQQAPVGTTVALIEHGMRVMSGVHKRLHRSQKKELRILNRITTENYTEYPYDVEGFERAIMAEDFSANVDVLPVSDPNIFSTTQRIAMAQTQLQMVISDPEMHGRKGRYEAYRRMYSAIGVPDVASILPAMKVPEPKDPAAETSEALTGEPMEAFVGQEHQLHIDSHILTMNLPSMINPVVLMAIEAHILEHFSLMSKEKVQQAHENDMQMIQASDPSVQESASAELKKVMDKEAATVVKGLIEGYAQMRAESAGEKEDPQQQLVKIRQQELAIQAQKLQLDAKNKDERLSLDREKNTAAQTLGFNRIEQADRGIASREQIAEDDRESQEGIADERNETSVLSSQIRASSFNKN